MLNSAAQLHIWWKLMISIAVEHVHQLMGLQYYLDLMFLVLFFLIFIFRVILQHHGGSERCDVNNGCPRSFASSINGTYTLSLILCLPDLVVLCPH